MSQDPYIALVRAVDVGYANTKFTLGLNADGTAIKTDLFPSLAVRLGSRDVKVLPGADKANGCCLIVNDKPFWVGPDVALNASGMEPRPVLDDYSRSDEYLAQLRGAFHCMLRDSGARSMVIKRLVVGLPLTTYHSHMAALKLRCMGVHHVDASDEGRTVTVENVFVIPQPQGTLMNFATSHAVEADSQTLVADIGGGTSDWFLGTKKRVNLERSGSHPKGMLACCEAVAVAAEHPRWINQYNVMERIDLAIRENRSHFHAAGRDWPLAKFRAAIDAVLEESMNKMLATIKETDDIDRIVITGGGAKAFAAVLRSKKPHLAERIKIGDDPVYSNVLGFQLFGEAMAKRAADAAR